MQKTLADYFKLIIEKKDDILCEFYERGAIMMEDEGMVIAGLLVGLNVIDCNLCIKEEDLDQPMGVIDFSLYLRDNKVPMEMPDSESAEGKSKMATILDQKNYLEELNRHLNATVTNLQQKLEGVQTTNALMKEDLAIAKNTILTLQEENATVKKEKDILLNDHKRQLEFLFSLSLSHSPLLWFLFFLSFFLWFLFFLSLSLSPPPVSFICPSPLLSFLLSLSLSLSLSLVYFFYLSPLLFSLSPLLWFIFSSFPLLFSCFFFSLVSSLISFLSILLHIYLFS
ncbi:RUN and FYVE domain-containing protein 2,RUN and FYVE domain-containing protein 1,Protein RUFY3 [Acanthosepion pharaonis]|uniref:RUN and FYVE domain-containing protein 2,RUN and FYVE domain-containing protein 1,Protein RUFY3 n=1 Tax=Acanthosepion pharaonis TaxID=158019 RepID=A0A812BWI5_ACAPH|nr:RUN and FYVE domain-containing protein 2,RUN and FYVE domain-containing protein 1,Protein RUFY3 [Sepia pharaonis]